MYWALISGFFLGEGKRKGVGTVIYGKKTRRIRESQKDGGCMRLEMMRNDRAS